VADQTSYIDPGSGTGYTYVSLAAWAAGEIAAGRCDLPGVLVGNQIAICRSSLSGASHPADTATVAFGASWTTDATHLIKIWCPTTDTGGTTPAGKDFGSGATHRHDGKWNANAYRMEPSSGIPISFTSTAKNTFIQGIQLKSATTAFYYEPTSSSAATCTVEQCMAVGNLSAGTSRSGFYASNGTVKVSNCMSWNFSRASCNGFYQGACNPAGEGYWYNNTAFQCTRGFGILSYRTGKLKNCLSIACTAGYYEDSYADWVMTNCASDLEDAEDTDPHNLVTVGFVDDGLPDLHLASTDTDVIGHGVDLSADSSYAVTVDIDNSTRPTGAGTWDIGADQYFSADTYLYPDGIPSVSAVGAPDIKRERPITVDGIASVAAVGAPGVVRERPIAVSGIASIAAVGAPDIKRERPISVSGIASVAAVVGPSILRERPITVSGIASVAAVGSPQTYSYTRQGAEPSLLLGESGYITRLGATYTGYIPDPDADPSADNGFIWTTEYRGFYSFDISPLSIAHITGAWLNFTSIAYEYEEDPPMCKMRVEAIDYDAVTLPVDLPAAWNAAIKGGGLFKIDSVDGMPDPFIGYYMDFGAIHGTDPDDLMNGDKSRIQFRTRDISGSSYDFLCLPLLSATWLDLTYTAPSGAVKKIRICAHAGI
jgi:hypothetical protein